MSVFFLLLFGAIAPKINIVSDTKATQQTNHNEIEPRQTFHHRIRASKHFAMANQAKLIGMTVGLALEQAIDLWLSVQNKHTN